MRCINNNIKCNIHFSYFVKQINYIVSYNNEITNLVSSFNFLSTRRHEVIFHIKHVVTCHSENKSPISTTTFIDSVVKKYTLKKCLLLKIENNSSRVNFTHL